MKKIFRTKERSLLSACLISQAVFLGALLFISYILAVCVLKEIFSVGTLPTLSAIVVFVLSVLVNLLALRISNQNIALIVSINLITMIALLLLGGVLLFDGLNDNAWNNVLSVILGGAIAFALWTVRLGKSKRIKYRSR